MNTTSMLGLSAAMASSKSENIKLISFFDLKDFATNAPLAALWEASPEPNALIFDFRRCHPQGPVVGYMLETYSKVLWEGILIACHILNPRNVYIYFSSQADVPIEFQESYDALKIICAADFPQDLPENRLIHNIETIWNLAKFFRREGADKRIWKLCCPGQEPVYREIPYVSNIRTILKIEHIAPPAKVIIGGPQGYTLTPDEFCQIPSLRSPPVMEFCIN